MRIWSLRLRLTNSRSIYVTIWLLPGKNVASFSRRRRRRRRRSLFDNARRDICNRSQLELELVLDGVGVSFGFRPRL